jgi:hypothetical protein
MQHTADIEHASNSCTDAVNPQNRIMIPDQGMTAMWLQMAQHHVRHPHFRNTWWEPVDCMSGVVMLAWFSKDGDGATPTFHLLWQLLLPDRRSAAWHSTAIIFAFTVIVQHGPGWTYSCSMHAAACYTAICADSPCMVGRERPLYALACWYGIIRTMDGRALVAQPSALIDLLAEWG